MEIEQVTQGDVSETTHTHLDEVFTNLVNECYNELVKHTGDVDYNIFNILELVAVGTTITARLVNVSGADKKRILIHVITKFFAVRRSQGKLTETEYSLVMDTIECLDTGIDVLFDFKKGKYDVKKMADATSKCCLFGISFLTKRPHIVYESKADKQLRKELMRTAKSQPKLVK